MEVSEVDNVFTTLQRVTSSVGEEAYRQISLMGRLMYRLAQNDPIPSIPWKVKILIPIALGYFVLPFDFIPDFIPIVGYIDDVAFIGFIWSMVVNFMQLYERWEKYEKRIEDLKKENQTLKAKMESGDDQKLCCVCMEQDISSLLKPCKHCCLCEDCAPIVAACPLCREPVKSWSRVFI
eukprot:TRINITY_DN491_c0_g1_i1.p1 TRINITY_DN491_c0_g1~~TRINITY_DN491_c0_g1_i1.p1  ORF type:complete len:192 (-),score=33.16 TRINITY_DN491_c0_g1_i1:56-592(-)